MKINLKHKWNDFVHTLESCWLCLKYPFLYSRNRWTGNHWDSWGVRKYLNGSPKNYKWVNGEWIEIPEQQGIWHRAYKYVPNPESEYHLDKKVIKSIFWVCWYYIVYFIANWILPIFHCIPTYIELDAMEPGWRKAFGIQMCDELKSQLKKDHYLYKYRITQIKEKWGQLRWNDEGHSDEVHKIIEKYENISWNTCILCGKPSTKITAGWISPYCDDCFPKNYMVYMKKWKNGKWHETKEHKKRYEMVEKSLPL